MHEQSNRPVTEQYFIPCCAGVIGWYWLPWKHVNMCLAPWAGLQWYVAIWVNAPTLKLPMFPSQYIQVDIN